MSFTTLSLILHIKVCANQNSILKINRLFRLAGATQCSRRHLKLELLLVGLQIINTTEKENIYSLCYDETKENEQTIVQYC